MDAEEVPCGNCGGETFYKGIDDISSLEIKEAYKCIECKQITHVII